MNNWVKRLMKTLTKNNRKAEIEAPGDSGELKDIIAYFETYPRFQNAVWHRIQSKKGLRGL